MFLNQRKKTNQTFKTKNKMKKETLEEAVKKRLLLNEKTGFIDGAKWQQERSYSDMQEYAMFIVECYISKLPTLKAKDWFEQFKKPTHWYNESETNERMNIIGQNGNDGEHYENLT